MNARHVQRILFILVIAPVIGCLGPRRSNYQSDYVFSNKAASPQADRVWQAIQETLRHLNLHLDRVDQRAGVITTLPAVSQHFFEFWRHDVDTRPDFWEATLNPMRRWVEVAVTRDNDQAMSKLSVVVHKERFSSLDRQFNSTGAVYEYFGYALPSTTGLAHVTAENDRWLEQGHDPAMEEYLLRAILKRAGLEFSRSNGNAQPKSQPNPS